MKKFIWTILISAFIFFPGIINGHTANASTPGVAAVQSSAESASSETKEIESSAGNETAAEEDPGIVGLFGLNWKLFLAQLINFGIVLFVLWKWVFGPVTAGLEKRAKKIEDSLEEAERITKDREDFNSWKKSEIAQARVEASAIITKSKQDSEILKNDTLSQTKTEQKALAEQTRAQLQMEKQAILNEAKTEITNLVISATEKILKGKLNGPKDRELIQDAIKQAQQ